MWNDERGFGFITPANGGEDVFVHRSGLGEGVTLSSGNSVTYEEQWDEKKRKHRALDVEVAADDAATRSEPAGGASESRGSSSSAQASGRARDHHIVGSFGDWAIARESMAVEGTRVRHRLVVRSDALQAKGDAKFRREEFQIVGDAKWEKRLYPAGGDKEDVVVLRPGDAPSRAASGHGKGHGRNWAVEGRPGTAFDIFYDPEAQAVSCEIASNESR